MGREKFCRLRKGYKKNRTKNVRFTSILMSITKPFVIFKKARFSVGVAKLSRDIFHCDIGIYLSFIVSIISSIRGLLG